MNMKFTSTEDSYRGQAWCMSSELTDNGDGTYTINDERAAAMLGGGLGSEIIVIDSPGKLLFVGDDGVAYDWTSSSGGGGGGGDVPAGYVVIVQRQTVTLTQEDAESDRPANVGVVEGYTVPSEIPEDLLVYVNNHELTYNNERMAYSYVDGSTTYVFGENDFEGAEILRGYACGAIDMSGDTPVFIAGDYTVVAYAPEVVQK